MKEEDHSRNPQRVIRAAGSQSLQLLKEIIETEGWTGEELDALAYVGRTPLQQAAWKGKLESLEYLLDHMGCDINVYSTKKFSYGKTAIFFALTQSRKEVVDYLLSRKDIKVAIVNNKGQSVLSLAASHEMPDYILKKIQQLEDNEEWWNFRATNSDGFEYGDLDPRFFSDRPLRESDIVTTFAINPTTKKTRKGGFERRNPEAAREWQRRRQQQNQSKKKDAKKITCIELTKDDRCELEKAWDVLRDYRKYTKKDCWMSLLILVKVNDKLRKAWIGDTVRKLASLDLQSAPWIREPMVISSTNLVENKSQATIRYQSLAEKVLTRLLVENKSNDSSSSGVPKPTDRKQKVETVKQLQYNMDNLMRLGAMLKSLQMASFEPRENQENLCLPEMPIFIDKFESLNALFRQLQQLLYKADLVIAIDTEWYQPRNKDDKTSAKLATVQLAYYLETTQSLSSFVIDLLVNDLEYQKVAKELVSWIFEANNQLTEEKGDSNKKTLWVLGFALGHDLTTINDFTSQNYQISDKMLDLQLLISNKSNRGQLPGLKKCASRYSQFPLCKKEQCSDWSKRPLSQSQLNYAGLDAAILLVLLTEVIKDLSS